MDCNLTGVTTTHRTSHMIIRSVCILCNLLRQLNYVGEKYFYNNRAARVVQLGLILTMTTATCSPNWTT